jgi:hypothetical protein
LRPLKTVSVLRKSACRNPRLPAPAFFRIDLPSGRNNVCIDDGRSIVLSDYVEEAVKDKLIGMPFDADVAEVQVNLLCFASLSLPQQRVV